MKMQKGSFHHHSTFYSGNLRPMNVMNSEQQVQSFDPNTITKQIALLELLPVGVFVNLRLFVEKTGTSGEVLSSQGRLMSHGTEYLCGTTWDMVESH